MSDFFEDSIKRLSTPEIKGCISVINSILGYKLKSADRQPFLYFHNYLTNPQPDFITEWRSDKKKGKMVSSFFQWLFR